MTNALVRPIIDIPPRLCPSLRECGYVDCVPVILRCDMAAPCQEIERGDVLCSISVFEFDGFCTRGEGEELMT